MNLKKVMAIGIALSIAAGSSASAFTSNERVMQSLGKEKTKSDKLTTQISQEISLQKLNNSDTVRVIVELEGEAVIEKATAKGLKIQDMSKSQVEGFQKAILNQQASLQSNIKSSGVNFNVLNNFTNVVNGFSVETTLEEAKKIELMSGVKSVTIANEYERPQPEMNSSGDITDTVPTWELGYKGEGTVISIIDTGVDPSHKDMTLTNPNNAELQIDEVENIVAENKLSGTYRTTKVPYGYNYMDQNQEVLDLGPDASEHGMHVAGIAAANGDVENGGIKGTASEAQVLAMKVFGNNPEMPSTYGDVIIKAIDDSVILGADVINMSLGSTAAYVNDEDPEQAAVNRAVDNGVVVAVSAGNSNVFGDGFDLPYAENPDYGVVGAPGLATDSLQVASIENSKMTGDAVEFTVDGKENLFPYTVSGVNILDVLKGQQLKVVDCGLGGTKEDFPATVAGNVALIQRGTFTFADKIANAEKAGAVAVIVYNNAGGGEGLINMAGPEGSKIPSVFIGNKGGSLIKANLAKDGFAVSFNGNKAAAPNPGSGSMSDFTSWGNTPNLEMKPEITGVGGNVWSLAQNNGYRNMSGTSMAAPNVAGGSALIVERVEKDFPELTGEAKAKMVKKIMMSTAVPHVDNGHLGLPSYGLPANLQAYAVYAGANYTSPRRQGAGVMNLYAAATTPAIVTDTTTDECKVNLKEISGNKATFTIAVENFSDKEVTYNVGGTVQTDLADSGYTLLQSQNIVDGNTGKFPISFSEDNITIPANGKTEVTITVDLSNAVTVYDGVALEEVFVNGGYVEGFVTLTDPTDDNAMLSIPYMGFKGEWDNAPAIDASIYDQDRATFYGTTAMATDVGGGNYNFLGVDQTEKVADETKIGFSPNGDGSVDTVTPVLSYLRNIKEMKVEIIDANGKVIRNLAEEFNLRKHYFDGMYNPYSILTTATWDGKANNKLVKDGDYTYRVKALIDYEGAEWQTYDFPVKVDTVAPTFNLDDVDYDDISNTLTAVAKDNNEDYMYKYALLKEGKPVTVKNEDGEDVPFESADGVFNLGDIDPNECTLAGYDYAGNMTFVDLAELVPGKFKEPTGPVEGDKTAPVVLVKTPEFFGMLNNNTATLSGTISDVSALSEFKINGTNVPFKFNKGTGLWEFEYTLEFVDGYHSIDIYSKDAAGNKLAFAHKIFVDGEAPVIDIAELPAQTTESTVKITGIASDNFPTLKVLVNGNVVKTIDADFEYFDQLEPASYDFNGYEVALEDGENTIVVEVVDAAGHVTTKQVTVNKVDEIVDDKAPTAPTIERVDGNIVVTATEPEDTAKIQYSYDKETWTDYADPIPAQEGSTIYVIAIDAAGNKSEVASYEIKDITPPTRPVITEENGKVTVTAADEDTAKLEYSLDGKNWGAYVGPVKVDEKETVYARAIDTVGNVSEVAEYTVTDKTAPTAPTVTIKDGVLTIAASDDDTAEIEYSLDGKEWLAYTESVKVEENTTIHVRAMDAAGNVSEVKVYKVPSTVNPAAPTKPAVPTVVEKDGVVTVTASDDITTKLEYSLDGKTWVPYTEPVKIAEKATISVRAVNVIDDKAAFSEVVELTVPDRTAPKAPKMSAKNNMVTVKAQDDDVVKIEYSLDKETWTEYKDPVKLAAKKTMYARAIDAAGNVSEISKLTMPSSGNSLPQTGAMVGSGLMALGGAATAAFGALMLKKRNRK